EYILRQFQVLNNFVKLNKHLFFCFFFFQAEDGIRDFHVTGVQTCALPIFAGASAVAVLEHLDARRRTRSDDEGRVRDDKVERLRSEERRVGKECRSRWSAYQ